MLPVRKYSLDFSSQSILWITGLSLFVLGPFDKVWTFWLSEHNIASFSDIFNRSIFEGNKLGASDLGVIIYIGSLLILLIGLFKPYSSPKYQKASLLASFLSYYGLILALGFVHPLKLIWGRMRPEALSGISDSNFTHWYQGGISNLHKINFAGSLPSGHTATFLMVIALLYGVYFLKQTTQFRLKVLAIGVLSFGGCIAMGVSRSMALKHWVSDWILSIGFGWFLLHYLFFNIWQMDYKLSFEGNQSRRLDRPKTSLLVGLPFILISIILVLRIASILWT